MLTYLWSENRKGRDHLIVLCVWIDSIKIDVNNLAWEVWLDLFGLRQEPVWDFCEHGIERSGYMQGVEFLE